MAFILAMERRIMCDFCSVIFDGNLLFGRFKKEEKKIAQKIEWECYKTLAGDNYIYKYGKHINIHVKIGNCFVEGLVDDIKYCPYCGRKLSE